MNQTVEQADTKDRILDAAERLFAEQGFEAASLRSITSAAAANLASVNYHFHSKQALAEAVLARRVGPVNLRRLELLDEYVREPGKGPLSLERVLEAFFVPALALRRDLGESGAHFLKFMGRMHGEPSGFARELLGKQFAEIALRFGAAMKRALPGIKDADLAWGVHFTIGAMAHVMVAGDLLNLYSQGACDPDDVDGLLRRLIAYTAAGLRSLASKDKRK